MTECRQLCLEQGQHRWYIRNTYRYDNAYIPASYSWMLLECDACKAVYETYAKKEFNDFSDYKTVLFDQLEYYLTRVYPYAE